MSTKKQGRKRAHAAIADGGWAATSLGGRVHKCGRSRDTNRDTAQWRTDVEELLKSLGGTALKQHITKKCIEPKDMVATTKSRTQSAYMHTDDGELGDGSTENSYDVSKMQVLQEKATAAAKVVEAAGALRPRSKKPKSDASAELQQNWSQSMQMYNAAWASATKLQQAVTEEMQNFIEENSAFDKQPESGHRDEGEEQTAEMIEATERPDELYELIKIVGTSQVQTDGTSPFGVKQAQFEAWAAKSTQQALWESREQLAKDVLLGTTLDHVHVNLNSIREKKTAWEMMNFVIRHHKPLESEDITEVCARFTFGQIGQDHGDQRGLHMDTKGKFETYESFISRVDKEVKYISNISSERSEDKTAIEMTIADSALTRIIKSAHTAAHPFVVQIRNLVSRLEGKSYAECCEMFRKEERQWQRERVPDADQLHLLGYSRTTDDRRSQGKGERDKGNQKIKGNQKGKGNPKNKGKDKRKGALTGDGGTRGDGKFRGKCYYCNEHCGYTADNCPKRKNEGQGGDRNGKDNDRNGKGGGRGNGGSRGNGGGHGKAGGRGKGGGNLEYNKKNFALLQRQLADLSGGGSAQQAEGSDSSSEDDGDDLHMMRDVMPDQILIQSNVFDGRVCVDSGAARTATGISNDVFRTTTQAGLVATASGNVASSRSTVIYSLPAKFQGQQCTITTIHPQANYIKPAQGAQPVRLISEKFLEEKLGFVRKSGHTYCHPDGYVLQAEWVHGILCLPCEMRDNRKHKHANAVRKRLEEIENRGGGFVIDNTSPALITLRSGRDTNEEGDDENDAAGESAGTGAGAREAEPEGHDENGDTSSADFNQRQAPRTRGDRDEAAMEAEGSARDECSASQRPGGSNVHAHSGGDGQLPNQEVVSQPTTADGKTQTQPKRKMARGKVTGRTGVRVSFSKEIKDKRVAKKSKQKNVITLPFRLLRRQHPVWKRLLWWVFGAPVYATLDKIDLDKYWPGRCMKLGQRGLLGYFVGQPDWLSPTVWMAVPPRKGKRGQKWKILRVSWSRIRAVEDQYVDRDRDKLVMPEGRNCGIRIVHGEHEQRPPVDDDSDAGPSAPRGRPPGWTKSCGLTYDEYRARHEVESTSSEDEVDVMRPPKDTAAADADEQMLLMKENDHRTGEEIGPDGEIVNALFLHEHVHFLMATGNDDEDLCSTTINNDLYLTGEWGEHFAQSLRDGKAYVKEHEQLTDKERMALPDIKDVVDMLMAKDYVGAWLSVVKEVNSFKEKAVVTAIHDPSDDPAARPGEKCYHLLPIWTRKFERGRFVKNKFRAALDGSKMKPGIDCRFDIFSPTPMSSTVKLMLALNATRLKRGLPPMRSIDLETFFLQTEVNPDYGGHKIAVPAYWSVGEMTLDEVTELHNKYLEWAKRPDGKKLLAAERRRWRQNKVTYYFRSGKMIYGDKAASRESNDKLDHVLTVDMHYTRSTYDRCLYWYEPKVFSLEHQETRKRKRDSSMASGDATDEVHMVCGHVDDLAHAGSKDDMLWFEQELAKYFTIGKAEDMSSFLGMSIDQDTKACTVHCSQPGLMVKLQGQHGHLWQGKHTPSTPLPPGTELAEKATEEEFAEAKDLPYANIVSTLAYASRMTALHLALPVALLSRHMSKWSKEHFALAVRVAHYACENKDLGITFSGYGNTKDDTLSGVADASFGERALLAHFVELNGAPFDHGIATARVVILSTTDAELRAAMQLARKVKGWRLLLNELPIRFRQDKPTRCEGDCSPAVTIVNNPGALGDATRHLKRSVLFMRECVATQETAYDWTPTRFMPADLGTKALTKVLHDEHLAELSGRVQANDWRRLKETNRRHLRYESILAFKEQELWREERSKPGMTAKRHRTMSGKRGISEDARTAAQKKTEDWLERKCDQTNLNLSTCDDEQISILNTQRLGFLSNKRMKMLRGLYGNFLYPADLDGHIFLAQMRAGFPKASHKNQEKATEFRKWKPCEHLCVDCFELGCPTIHGARWVYVFTDHKVTKKRFTMLARARAHYPRVLMRLLGRVKSLGWEVRVLRCDGAGELVGEPARLVMEHHDNIQLEVSSPRQPQENGSSERAVRSVTEKARALMMNAPHLPAGCGGLAVLHASALLEFHPISVPEEYLQ